MHTKRIVVSILSWITLFLPELSTAGATKGGDRDLILKIPRKARGGGTKKGDLTTA